jgi:hypothetical protein
MKTIKVRYDGRVFIPEESLDLPTGTVREIPIGPPPVQERPQSGPVELSELLSRLPADPDWPEDGAAQVDHYLYGMPKRP